MTSYLGVLGYAVVASLYTVVAALSLASWRRGKIGGTFIVACLFSIVWASSMAAEGAGLTMHAPFLYLVESLRSGTWIAFVILLLARSGVDRRLGISFFVVWIAMLVFGVAAWVAGPLFRIAVNIGPVMIYGGLVLALSGLILIEQLFRNSSAEARWPVKPLVIGLGGMFAYDLFLYSQGILFGAIEETIWHARGVVNILFVPLLAIAARRNDQWELDIFISRHVVFYSTTLLAVGIYLLLMSAGGYLLLLYGGSWGGLAQTVFFVGAILVLATLLFSNSLRGRLRVFISKHFFRNKYDYRAEWLRLISTLAGFDDSSTRQLAIKAMAQIVGSRSGLLWHIEETSREYRLAAAYEAEMDAPVIGSDDPLMQFIRKNHWVVDLDEYRQNPEFYQNVRIPDWLCDDERAWLLVPLEARRKILGLVLLYKPRRPFKLNYEDRDLLKTAGHHIAVHLAKEDADSRLAEAQQFEAYNKLTAFLMHDLNNLIAQQSLIVKNAERHKRNPDFVDDAMQTIANSVQRMRRVMDQLQRRESEPVVKSTVLKFLISAAADRCDGRVPAVEIDLEAADIPIVVDRDRFVMVLTHLIRNAQDATPENGSVGVSVRNSESNVEILVSDTGSGMSKEFIRDRLFRPFDSTKGSQGMGIGVYQAREYARSLGGDLTVSSAPGKGSTFRMSFPLARPERKQE